MSRAAAVAVAVVVGCAACASRARNVGTAAPPAVGVATLRLDDPARDRRLTTGVWYPAADGARERALTWNGIFRGTGARDAALRPGGPLPLVLLSHGSGGGRANLAWLAEPLARAGWLVAAVDHPGDGAGGDTAATFAVWRRPRDLSIVLDRLLADPTFGPRVDGARVAAVGHSSGGYTVLALAGARFDPDAMRAYCAGPTRGPECARLDGLDVATIPDVADAGADLRDARVRAVVALAPVLAPAATAASLAAIRIPVLLVGSPADERASFDANARALAGRIPGARLVTLAGAGHFAFLPACNGWGRAFVRSVCAAGTSEADRARVHEETVAAVGRFLATALAAAPASR